MESLMNRSSGHYLAAALTSAVLVIAPLHTVRAATAIVRVDVAVVAQGYRTTELLNKTVYNEKNEKIGTFDDLMISKEGLALVAVLQVGGFLGLGGHLVAVPFKSLVIKDADNKITLPGASKESLGALVEFHYSH